MGTKEIQKETFDAGYAEGYENGRRELFAYLINMFPESNMFHTPKSKEDATEWCATQGGIATIGFMVGLNYVSHQLAFLYDCEVNDA